MSTSEKKATRHKEELERLREAQPEFYTYLKDHDKELLEFDSDIDEDAEIDNDDEMLDDEENDTDDLEKGPATTSKKEEQHSQNVITSTMVDSWCDAAIGGDAKIGAVRSLMKAFRTACHYGDDSADGSAPKFSIMSGSVFNKIMLFVLSEMDGILRTLLKLPPTGGKKETITELMSTRQWKNHSHIVKSYFGNALHVLNQMTDTQMISFTIRRLKYSAVLLAAFPSLLRRYIKVVLHFWGTGGGALPVVSFLFMRDLCVRLGSECIEECFKGIYKAYVLSCQFVNATKLQHINFLGNCVSELLRVDLPAAYQHAFVFIRQLAMILREALTMKTKEAFRKVYEWKFINCLELWTGAVCEYGLEPEFRPLAYPLTQIITGVARLVPTARYLPLRLRCVKMLNRIAASTGTFIPVSLLLLDMLDMKELNRAPTGGVGKAVDLRTILKVGKPTLKTRAFQEACVFAVVEEVAEHLAQWSCSVAFNELSFIPSVRLRNFCKSTKVERFRREMRELIRQIEKNAEFTNKKRMSISFLPNDPAAASFLEEEKSSKASPLLQYVETLRQKSQQRNDSLVESNVVVGAKSSVFGSKIPESDEDDDDDIGDDEEGAAVFSTSWLPGNASKNEEDTEEDGKKKKKKQKNKKGKKIRKDVQGDGALDEDVVEDLVLSSDEDEDEDGFSSEEDFEDEPEAPAKQQQSKKRKQSGEAPKQQNKKRKQSAGFSKKKPQFHGKNSKKKKKAN